MLKYDKLFELFKRYNYTVSKIRDTGLLGMATYYGLKNGTKGLDARSINKLCNLFNCQPGDIMEYIPDDANTDNANSMDNTNNTTD